MRERIDLERLPRTCQAVNCYRWIDRPRPNQVYCSPACRKRAEAQAKKNVRYRPKHPPAVTVTKLLNKAFKPPETP